PGVFLAAIAEAHGEAAVRPAHYGCDGDAAPLDAILIQLAAAKVHEGGRRDPVARQISMHRLRAAISWLTEIADEHAAPAPAKHQRRAQTGWPASDNHYVEHLPVEAARQPPA